MRFTKLCRYAAIPIYALGGIDEITAKRMIGSGAAGVAAVGAMIKLVTKV